MFPMPFQYNAEQTANKTMKGKQEKKMNMLKAFLLCCFFRLWRSNTMKNLTAYSSVVLFFPCFVNAVG